MTDTTASNLVLTQLQGGVGLITLWRPQALNALTLPMVRALAACLRAWRDDPAVCAVAIRGSSKGGPFGHFCAGGDIRFLHQAALAGNPELEDFFSEEYALNHLIHTYPKPYIAFMDGICMGGGMGLAQGAALRIVTERSRLAMPETAIGFFPDVGGGYFLSRCPGRVGEYLALSGCSIEAAEALAWGLADAQLGSAQLPELWHGLSTQTWASGAEVLEWLNSKMIAKSAIGYCDTCQFDEYFSASSALAIVQALEASSLPWAQHSAATLRQRSPLMLEVTLQQIRRARGLTLADALRLERGMARHCFHGHGRAGHETLEGIRALAVDKDQRPQWSPVRLEDLAPATVAAFFASPWPVYAHPLRDL